MGKSKDGLDNLLHTIEKEFGKGVAMIISDEKGIPRIPRWPISSPKFMDILGGGIPKGRIIELYGAESSGKTSLACYLAGQVQQNGGVAAFVDAEQSFDPFYMRTFGFDVTKSIYVQPSSGEQALNIVETMVESGEVDFIVVDSVTALVPEAELNGEMGDQQMGLQARLMSKACRKLINLMATRRCTVLFINQIRMKIGVMYGNPEETTGGKALKFYSSIRLDARKKENIMRGQEVVGQTVRIKTVKNKTALPFKKTELNILFNEGIQVEEEYIDFAITHGIIEKGGPWYTIKQTGDKYQGKEAVKEVLLADPDLFAEIRRQTIQIMYPDGLPQDEPVTEEVKEEALKKRRSKKVEEVQEDMDLGDDSGDGILVGMN